MGDRQVSFELLLENTVLFDEIIDDRLLVAVKPAGQRNNEEMERLYNRCHSSNRLSVILPDNNIIRFIRIFAPYAVPYTPISHPFVERLIGTIRREYLGHIFFWNTQDLERKFDTSIQYYNQYRVHQSLDGDAPVEVSGDHQHLHAKLGNYSWVSHCNGLFQTPIAA
jgi:hypothetical protein